MSDNWKHRSAGMLCRTCMFFIEKKKTILPGEESDREGIGRCRKHAPTLNGWPAIFATDWCGDHKLDEEKI